MSMRPLIVGMVFQLFAFAAYAQNPINWVDEEPMGSHATWQMLVGAIAGLAVGLWFFVADASPARAWAESHKFWAAMFLWLSPALGAVVLMVIF